MENRKRPGSYNKRNDNKKRFGGERREDKPFKKEEDNERPKRSFGGSQNEDRPKRPYKKFDSNGPRRSFDKPGHFKKDGEDDKKPFRREGGFKKDFGDKEKGDRPYRKFNSDRPGRPSKDFNDRPARSFDKPGRFKKESDGDQKPFKREGGFKKDFSDKEKGDRPYKKFDSNGPRRSFNKPGGFKKDGDDDKKPFKRDGGIKKDFGDKEKGDRPYKKFHSDRADRPRKPFDKPGTFKRDSDDKRPFEREDSFKKDFKPVEETKRGTKDLKTGQPLKFHKFTKFDKEEKEAAAPEKAMTLNKYIAHSGECSRREAAEMVKQGKVKVNGELVLEPGYRVGPEDNVTFAGKKLTPTKHFVYVLLNKPKGYITTTDDPQERATVMDLVEGVDAGRLFPVGRLDRNTSGLLLLTNDGDIAQKLSHPSYETKKVYQVTLDRPLEREDFEKILKGVELEDGKAKVDALSYLDAKNEIGLEIHSGKNRIVRRIFESLKYDVEKLDRMMYAGLTKKNLPRGKWRLLTEKELVFLKHFKAK